tara:strand:+ start:204951 stop:205547 length:597 start_codon:yes stop_codon:yes gene_type:complete
MNRLNPMNCIPVTLTNNIVTLEPIALKHASDIGQAIDKDVFKYMPMRSSVITPSEIRRYIEFQIKRPNTVTFAIIDNTTKRAIGSTSYLNISADHYGLEIGSTWITKSARGTKINPSMKHLMLKHAFEELGAIRVVLCTDNRNEHSKAAISKLGATSEGILRNHIIMPDGHFRDSATYSIIPEQWETVSQNLLARINA